MLNRRQCGELGEGRQFLQPRVRYSGVAQVERVEVGDGCQVLEPRIRHLLKKLTSLNLSCTNVTDAGLKHLAPLQNLSTLILTDTRITDKGLSELGALKNLSVLILHSTDVSDGGIRALRKQLPKCQVFR
jgi:hypothetical protein